MQKLSLKFSSFPYVLVVNARLTNAKFSLLSLVTECLSERYIYIDIHQLHSRNDVSCAPHSISRRKNAHYHHDNWSLERRKQPRASSFSINHLLFLSPWLDLHHGRTPRHIERSLSTSALLSAFIQERNSLCQVSSLTFAEAHHSAYPSRQTSF